MGVEKGKYIGKIQRNQAIAYEFKYTFWCNEKQGGYHGLSRSS